MPVSTAIHVVPETAPASATDRRPYLLATRANAAVKAAAVSVGTTAAELTASLARRRKVYVKSLAGNGDVYLGGSGVSTSNGYVLRAKEELWLDLTPGARLYGVTAYRSRSAPARSACASRSVRGAATW